MKKLIFCVAVIALACSIFGLTRINQNEGFRTSSLPTSKLWLMENLIIGINATHHSCIKKGLLLLIARLVKNMKIMLMPGTISVTTAIDKAKFLLIGLPVFLTACNPDAKYMEVGDVCYIESFPSVVTIDSSTPVISDMEGMVNAFGSDSLMVGLFEGSPFIRIYSTETGQKLGEFLSKGQGPKEFTQMPSNISIEKDNHCEILNFTDIIQRKYFKMNINESILAGTEVYDTVIVSENFEDLKYIRPIMSDTLTWHYDYNHGGLIRAISDGKKMTGIPNLGNVEDDWSDYETNTISFIPAVNSDEGIVAEAMIQLNQINLYSLRDSTFRKTICVGQNLDDVVMEDRKSRQGMKRTYQRAQAIGNTFAFLYAGVSEKDYREGKFTPQIQFFTSFGEPVLMIDIPFVVNSFYITTSGTLYLFSNFGSTENLYRYDVPQIKELLTPDNNSTN